MSETIDALSFWGITDELVDFFKPNIDAADYTTKAIDRIHYQYDRASHHEVVEVVLVQNLLGQLADFAELMRLNNSRLTDSPSYQQNVYQVFNTLAETISSLKAIRDNYAVQSTEYSTCSSALIYSQRLITHYAEQLMNFEPHSLALKWYKEWSTLHTFDF